MNSLSLLFNHAESLSINSAMTAPHITFTDTYRTIEQPWKRLFSINIQLKMKTTLKTALKKQQHGFISRKNIRDMIKRKIINIRAKLLQPLSVWHKKREIFWITDGSQSHLLATPVKFCTHSALWQCSVLWQWTSCCRTKGKIGYKLL